MIKLVVRVIVSGVACVPLKSVPQGQYMRFECDIASNCRYCILMVYFILVLPTRLLSSSIVLVALCVAYELV